MDDSNEENLEFVAQATEVIPQNEVERTDELDPRLLAVIRRSMSTRRTS